MMITAALVRPTRCSRSARASARFACSRSALLGSGGFLAHGGGGTRGPRPLRRVNGRHFGTGRLILVDGEWALRIETLDDDGEAGDEPDAVEQASNPVQDDDAVGD